MSTYSYAVLPEQSQEDALHAVRLLQVEERPFARVTRHLLGKDSLLKWTPPAQLPSPPPEDEQTDTQDAAKIDDAFQRERFREDILLDFSALESSILRIQLIQSSNARERERYAAEKAKILETAQAVKDNTLQLRAQLAEAQRVLELRKGYDELAAKLIDPKKLKPRAETTEDIVKLEKEIEELQQESADYEGTRAGRREAFDRVAAEGQAMMKVVKGIKDEPEPEKDENMDDGEGEDAATKGERSRLGTPALEAGGRTPVRGGDTPLPHPAEGTPRPSNKMIDVDEDARTSSVNGSPMLQAQGEDVDMADGGPPAALDSGLNHDSLEAQPKTSTGMEVTAEQVVVRAEGMLGDEGRVEIAAPLDQAEEHQLATPAEEMDES